MYTISMVPSVDSLMAKIDMNQTRVDSQKAFQRRLNEKVTGSMVQNTMIAFAAFVFLVVLLTGYYVIKELELNTVSTQRYGIGWAMVSIAIAVIAFALTPFREAQRFLASVTQRQLMRGELALAPFQASLQAEGNTLKVLIVNQYTQQMLWEQNFVLDQEASALDALPKQISEVWLDIKTAVSRANAETNRLQLRGLESAVGTFSA